MDVGRNMLDDSRALGISDVITRRLPREMLAKCVKHQGRLHGDDMMVMFGIAKTGADHVGMR